MSDRVEEDLKYRIKGYWARISKIEDRIGELSGKGVSYSAEVQKRKSLLNNVKKLEKCLKFDFVKDKETETIEKRDNEHINKGPSEQGI